MTLLAISTTVIITGIVVFLGSTLVLVSLLLFAKAKLMPSGEVNLQIKNK